MPTNREWLIAMAEKEDGQYVGAGVDLDALRKDWESGEYKCTFEAFVRWALGQEDKPDA